jgi:hypothetical protein
MAEPISGVTRFPLTPKHFVDLVCSLEALKAVHPERSRSSEVRAAIAELERLLGNATVRLQSIRNGDIRN